MCAGHFAGGPSFSEVEQFTAYKVFMVGVYVAEDTYAFSKCKACFFVYDCGHYDEGIWLPLF